MWRKSGAAGPLSNWQLYSWHGHPGLAVTCSLCKLPTIRFLFHEAKCHSKDNKLCTEKPQKESLSFDQDCLQIRKLSPGQMILIFCEIK